jgi:hypothetical protein
MALLAVGAHWLWVGSAATKCHLCHHEMQSAGAAFRQEAPTRSRKSLQLPHGPLNLSALAERESILYVDAEIARTGLDLCMAEQHLRGAQVGRCL